MNSFGSALPGCVNQNVKLEVLEEETEEYEFGWVFFYNTREFINLGDAQYAIGGNCPIIINKYTGALIETGTAHELAYYVNNYRKTGDPHSEA